MPRNSRLISGDKRMHKPAESGFALADVIRERWSPMAFSARPIAPEILGSLFEAARWAASSFGEQPWAFCVATQDQPTEFAAMLRCLMEANQQWARHASALVISCAKLNLTRNDQPNRYAYHDVGLATQNLILQAMSHGIYSHPMGGFDREQARAVLQIPESHEAVAAIAIGYPAEDLAKLNDSLRERQLAARTR